MWWTFRDQLVSQVNLETRQPTDRWVVNPDLARSLAKRSEIARFPNRFERGCEGAGAGCALRPDGKVAVVDTCHKGSPDGPVEMAEGEAAVVAPGKLDVTFVPWLRFAKGDYWVLSADPACSVAIVGDPKRRTGWFLARNRALSQGKYDKAVSILDSMGYDTCQLQLVAQ